VGGWDLSGYYRGVPENSPPDTASFIAQRRRAAKAEPSRGYLVRKQALLRAAADVLRAKGLDALRMEDVAREINVDRATLYYYFDNKQQLFREVIIDSVAANVALARSIAAEDKPAHEKLRALLTSLMDSYDRWYPLMFVYIQEDMRRVATDDSPELALLAKLGDDYDEVVIGVIEQGIAEGDFSADTPATVTAYALIGAASWSHRWYKPGGRLTGREIGERYSTLFLEGLLTGPARRRLPKSDAR
jgi:TetR/AcrR family transcriptional regulator, cholesterol catabolism regulator